MTNETKQTAVDKLKELQLELMRNEYQYGWIISEIDSIIRYLNRNNENED